MPPKPAARGEYIETETGNKISRRASILGPKHIILAGKCVIQHDVVVHGDLVRPAAAQTRNTSSSTTAAAADSKPSTTTTSSSSSTNPATQDSVSIHLGRYVFVSPHVTLHPPSRLTISSSSQTPSTDPSIPNPPATTQSLTYYPLRIADHVYIGPHTHVQAASIGSHVSIGAHCVVGNFCFIKDHVRVEDYTVLPPHSVWAPGSVVAGRPARVVGEVGDGYAATESGKGGTGEGRRRWEVVGNRK